MNKFFSEIKNKCTNKKILYIIFVASIIFSLWHLLDDHDRRNCLSKYSFANRRFACFAEHTIDKRDYRQLREDIVEYISEEKNSGRVGVVSVFFRDLESGPTLGINENIDFIPASLLKLPNVLVLMRLEEDGEIDLSQIKSSYKGVYSSGDASLNSLISGIEIKPNTLYTLDELIFSTLANSDNIANKLILNYIDSIDAGRELISQIYRDLGIIEVSDKTTPAINTRGYSTIFRMLYNSSFLNPDNSEKLLGILSKSVDAGGLRHGVPVEIEVAHKYGERVLEGENQLHDCGIIYYPTNPYLLCIMTRGKDLEHLQSVITHISKMVYQEFDSRRIEDIDP